MGRAGKSWIKFSSENSGNAGLGVGLDDFGGFFQA